MIALVAAAEAARLDAATAREASIPPLLLMEAASLRIWDLLAGLLETDPGLAAGKGPIVALAGKGNNGGDALAVLRHARFAGHRDLAAILVAEKGSELFDQQLASLRALGIPIVFWETGAAEARKLIGKARVVIDGIAGTGLAGALRKPGADLVSALGGGAAPVLAIDLPSGLGEAWTEDCPSLAATWTASIEPRKACLYFPSARALAGQILPLRGIFPVDSAITAQASLLEETDLPGLLPRIPASAHKGSRGRLGLLAGSPGMVGAAGFAAAGAAAAGIGLVSFFADSEIYPALAGGGGPGGLSPAVIRRFPAKMAELGAPDALVVGPGWGQSPEKARLLAEILDSGLALVLDADALRLLPSILGKTGLAPGARILCPHPGEFEALSGIPPSQSLANPAACLSGYAGSVGSVVILKSHVTWIASPDGRIAVWEGLEAGLGTAGSGDVLAGLAGGFLAALSASSPEGGGPELAFRAACAAVVVHGLAGRAARARRGWFTAADLAEEAALLASQACPSSLDPPPAFL